MPWHALRFAKTAHSLEMEVHLFLLDKGVEVGSIEQNPPEGYPDLRELLQELIDMGIEVKACATCLKTCRLTSGDMMEGIKVGAMKDLALWVEKSSKVIPF